MRTALLLLALGAANLSAAMAPDSIAGKLFRESGGVGGLRNKWELSVVFSAEGSYHFLKHAGGSTLTPNGGISLFTPPADGTYTYARTSDLDATIVLSEPGGTLFDNFPSSSGTAKSFTFHLHFLTESTGLDQIGPSFALVDPNANQSAPAINASLRGTVAAGHPLVAGFVIPGTGVAIEKTRDVLIRVVGPALGQFGVTGFWADPDFQIFHGSNPAVAGAHFSDWAQTPFSIDPLLKIFALSGAFALPAISKDAVAVVRLEPGNYTVVASAAPGDPGGEVLIEIYFLP